MMVTSPINEIMLLLFPLLRKKIHLPNTNQYIYLEIFFNKSLDLEPIITKMNSKINYAINFLNF
jgi:hypothetical protein